MKQKLGTRTSFRVFLFIGFSFFFLSSVVMRSVTYADNATVLPKGAWAIFNENRFFFDVTDAFNNEGDLEPLAEPLNDVPIANLIPGLPSFVNLGSTVVDFSQTRNEYEFLPAYGLTDRLTVGAIIRYIDAESTLSAGVNTSDANFGTSPFLINPANPIGLGAPCFPPPGCTSGGPLPGTEPVDLQDIQTVLGLAGFKPVTNWHETGFGDTDVGARYQYYRTDKARAAFTGAVRFPTGREDDPDNLVDQPLGVEPMVYYLDSNRIYYLTALALRVPWGGNLEIDWVFQPPVPFSSTRTFDMSG